MSDLRRANGELGIMEEFCLENGITTYTKYKNSKGKEYLQNNDTGEIIRLKKSSPKYMKVVK